MIEINLFGKLAVCDANGDEIAVAGAKTIGLLAFLALSTEMPPSRERLVAMFWGDRFTDQARQSLRQAVAKLKRTFEAAGVADAIVTEGDRIGLNPASVRVDVDDFLVLSKDTSEDATATAVSMLKGPLLDGVYGQQAEFEDWLASERQRVSEIASRVMERAASQASQSGDVTTAIAIARRVSELDPWSDSAQMPLIRILAQKGDRAAAVQHFKKYEDTLKSEIGVGPGQELLKLMGQVRGEGFFAEEDGPAPAPATAPIQSKGGGTTTVVVMPFSWIAAEKSDAFLVDGIVDDLKTKLARFTWLTVKEGQADGASPDDEGVTYRLQGAMRSQGDKYRLTVQLVDGTSGRYLWVERYDRQTTDTFDLQDELSDTIAGSVEAVVERLAGSETKDIQLENANAWDCYHRGLAIQYEFDAATNKEAQKYFRRAIDLDPNFGLAYARLSYAIVISVIYFEEDAIEELLDEAIVLARKAARLEPNDAVARFALGRAHLARGEYSESITQLKMSIELNPNLAQAHCGLGDSMTYRGELDEAVGCFDEAVRISPKDPYRWAFWSYRAMAHLFAGKFDEAIQWAEGSENVPNSHYWSTAVRASALAHAGRMDEAEAAVAKLTERRPGISCDFVASRLFYLKDPDQVEIYVSGLRKAGLP